MYKNIKSLLLVCLLSACSDDSNNSYFPSNSGIYWQYDVTVLTMDLEKKSKNVIQSLPNREDGSRNILPRQINHGVVNFIVEDEEGFWYMKTPDQNDEQGQTDKSLLIPHVIEIGQSWTGKSQTHVLEGVVDPFRRLVNISVPVSMEFTIASMDETVVVPAGTFENCLKISGTGKGYYNGDKTIRKSHIKVTQTDWYAPGIGLVKRFREEDSDNKVISHGEYTEELEIYSH